MKRLPIKLRRKDDGPTLWRSVAEQRGEPSIQRAKEREFQEGAYEPPTGVERRTFLGIMGASIALTAAACRRPEEKILPYVKRPEDIIPGKPLFFATTFAMSGDALGVLVESHEGRPTKIEGNPRHPESLGGTSVWAQASVLDLYDPDRSQNPSQGGEAKTWGEASAALKALGSQLAQGQGKGVGIVVDGQRSPMLESLLERLQEKMPEAEVVRYEAFSDDNLRQGAGLAYGEVVETLYDLSSAKVLVTLDSDALVSEGLAVRHARSYAANRQVETSGEDIARHYAIESIMTPTGAMADHRLRMESRAIAAFAAGLASALNAQGVDVGAKAALSGHPALNEDQNRWAQAIAKDLAAKKGASVVVAGRRQPAAVHALVHLINHALGNVGKTVRYREALVKDSDGPTGIVELAKKVGSGIDTLIVLGGNPAFNAPADAAFAEAIKKAKTSIHLSTHVDETSEAATWHLNRAHMLESWGDAVSASGAFSVVQPLIAPLYDGKTEAEVLDLLLGGDMAAYDLCHSSCRAYFGVDFDGVWEVTLHDGISPRGEADDVEVTPAPDKVDEALGALKPASADGYEVCFDPDPHAYDGRFANSGWMQENPCSMHRMTWGNAATLSPKAAAELGVEDGDLVKVTTASGSVELPALIAPGQADKTIGITIGQGRRKAGRVGNGVGVDTNPLRTSEAFYVAGGGSIAKGGGHDKLARVQDHYSLDGRPLVLEGTVEQYKADPHFAQNVVKHPPLVSLFADVEYPSHRWGMNIDLAACTGCGACNVACYAENNNPVLGKEGVIKSREMNWIRIDRYYEGSLEDPRAYVQPMLCQHCENAPCEQVCPVGATTHSPGGINEMAYNRCIGTKYCGNNCPYKVRRFNYLEYNGDIPESRKLQFNPDVTVRSRGVMEKCTFCVQRVNQAKIQAKVEGRDRVRDGEVVAACQGACPTGAISFGDLADPSSKVTKAAGSPRSYEILLELNVRPRVSYRARIRNLNPELESA